jgi:hypothetical protein
VLSSIGRSQLYRTGYHQIVKESGQLGTESPLLTLHREEINAGKNIGKANETTPEQNRLCRQRVTGNASGMRVTRAWLM